MTDFDDGQKWEYFLAIVRTNGEISKIFFKKCFLSGAQGKNSSAKWLHLTVFYVLFHSVDPKKYWSNGQQGKNLT